jgi:hypothetical protein
VTTVRRRVLGSCLAATAVLLPAAPALGDEPERTGWWSRLSAGDAVVPMPTTAEGDLRITNAPDGPAAYSAVLYSALGATDAVLTLEVRTDRTLGTPEVVACVTADLDWPDGGNQPYADAPAYDCDRGSVVGELAPDGTTLTFLLDAGSQAVQGTWSLALGPMPDSTAPFSLELAAPGADAFVPGPPDTAEEDPFVPEEPAPASEPGSGDAFAPGGFAEPFPAVEGGVVEQPLLAGGADQPLPAEAGAPPPELAPGAAPGAAPVLQATPAGVVEDLGTGRRLLALLVLAGGSAAVGYAAGQQRPGPRLIGGRARALGTPALAVSGPSEQDRPRGIGRFAKVREAAPRRLR